MKRFGISKLAVTFSFALLLATSTARAGTFDCSVIYDEFDSLMNKNFLTSPQNYVKVTTGKMSRNDYNSVQKGIFLQKAENKGWGIAIVHTNRNTWGKFLYTWGAPNTGNIPSLLIRELTLFGRVVDGYQPRTSPQIAVASSYTVDLDAARIASDNTADVWFHNVDNNIMYVEAVNGAEIYFPLQSMCR
jgi:hypothetical protein